MKIPFLNSDPAWSRSLKGIEGIHDFSRLTPNRGHESKLRILGKARMRVSDEEHNDHRSECRLYHQLLQM
jgi:hypothetical protein